MADDDADIQQLREQLEAMEIEKLELEEQLVLHAEVEDRLEKTVAKLEGDREDLKRQIHKLQTHMETSNARAGDESSKLMQLQQQLQEAIDQLSARAAQIVQLELQIDKQEDRIRVLECEKEDLSISLEEAETTKEFYSAEISDLELFVASMSEQIKGLGAELGKARGQEEFSKLEQDIERHVAETSRLRSDLDEARQRYDEVHKAVVKAQEEAANAKANAGQDYHNLLMETHAKYQQEITELRKAFEEVEQQRSPNVSQDSMDPAALQARVHELEGDLKTVRARHTKSENTRQMTVVQLLEQTEQREQAERILVNMEAKSLELSQKLSDADAKAVRLEKRLAELTGSLEIETMMRAQLAAQVAIFKNQATASVDAQPPQPNSTTPAPVSSQDPELPPPPSQARTASETNRAPMQALADLNNKLKQSLETTRQRRNLQQQLAQLQKEEERMAESLPANASVFDRLKSNQRRAELHRRRQKLLLKYNEAKPLAPKRAPPRAPTSRRNSDADIHALPLNAPFFPPHTASMPVQPSSPSNRLAPALPPSPSARPPSPSARAGPRREQQQQQQQLREGSPGRSPPPPLLRQQSGQTEPAALKALALDEEASDKAGDLNSPAAWRPKDPPASPVASRARSTTVAPPRRPPPPVNSPPRAPSDAGRARSSSAAHRPAGAPSPGPPPGQPQLPRARMPQDPPLPPPP